MVKTLAGQRLWSVGRGLVATGQVVSDHFPQTTSSLVTEVAYSSEEHGQAQAVGGGDYFGVALRASGLNDGGCTRFGDFFHTIGKREKSVGCGYGSFQRELGLHGADLGGIDAAHLTSAHANGLSVASVDNGIRFNVFAHLPSK